ncbi:uncharacterized protein LOC134532028 [Bacillus rossius redtenbacheri]|uniref:uncharacterized protein LOC134532028 n=1 Tax=Bacillus rossius redtenbacheri TaxID=93214 RepID=UPI002FDD7A12
MAVAVLRFVSLVLLALYVSAFMQTSETDYGSGDGAELQRSGLDDKLKAIIEGFRQNMTQPMPSLGLPALDPFAMDQLPVNLSLNGIRATGVLRDLTVAGLSSFVLDRVHLQFVGLHLQFRFFLPEVTASARCNVSVGDHLQLSGDDPITLTVTDLAFSGDISIGAHTDGKENLYLKNVTLDFLYGKITVDLGDFSEDARLTTALQGVVNDLLPQLLDREKLSLLAWAQDEVMSFGDHLLENTTISDILGSIG